jgi:hypothetical protein
VFTNHIAHALKVQQPRSIRGFGKGDERRYRLTDDGRSELQRAAASEPATHSAAHRSSRDRDSGQPGTVAIDPPHLVRELPRRAFDAKRVPTPGQLQAERLDRVETFARQERARIEHQRLLQELHAWLIAAGWTELVEDRAVDLWGTGPDGTRVIFEAKTISDNALPQCRAGLAQLLEYRALYGSADDGLCLVVNSPVTQTRAEVLDELGVGVLVIKGSVIMAANENAVAFAEVTIEGVTRGGAAA